MAEIKMRFIFIYGAIALAIGGLYYQAKDVMTLERPWAIIYLSNITLNFILFFGMAGYLIDRYAKKHNWSKTKGWMAWGILMLLLVLMFRFVGGYQTIFG